MKPKQILMHLADPHCGDVIFTEFAIFTCVTGDTWFVVGKDKELLKPMNQVRAKRVPSYYKPRKKK